MNRRDFLGSLSALPLALHGLGGARKGSGSDVDRAIAGGAEFLLGRRSEDGAWRSEVYGAFRDGASLTPLVYLALMEAGVSSPRTEAWISKNSGKFRRTFPVHSASYLLQAGLEPEGMVEHLLSLQLMEGGGWKPAASEYGGWSYAPVPARPGAPLPPFQEPNLTATALAVDGLAAAGLAQDYPAWAAAATFITRHQHGDGGFSETGPNRTGDDQGPYTSATSDALRALQKCGVENGAASAWLSENADIDDSPHLRYFAAASLAQTLGGVGEEETGALLEDQQDAGSWHNPMGEMREDDPIVATALALRALVPLRRNP